MINSLAARGKNNTNPEQNIIRKQDQKSTITELVYKYLRKVAYTDSVRKQRNNACSKFRKGNARRKTIHPPRRHMSAGIVFARNQLYYEFIAF